MQRVDEDKDARADIFAFGAVLYETLTGRRAFAGETPRALMTAIMTTEPPPLSSIEPSAPAAPFIPTEERFVDPTTGRRLRVYVDPATGERRYFAEEQRPGG